MIWAGYIVAVYDGVDFLAVVDGEGHHPDREIIFATAAVAPEDRASLRPGLCFTWQTENPYLTFSREVWTPEELAEAKRRATERAGVWK